MPITGEMLIGATALRGTDKPIRATEAATGKPLDPAFGGGTAADVERACALAWAAFDTYRETGPEERAALPGGDRPGDPRHRRPADRALHGRERPAARRGSRASAAAPSASSASSPRWCARAAGSRPRIDPALPRAQAAAALRPAAAPHRRRAGRGVRRQQLPARLLGGRRRHRLGAGRRLPGGRQGALGPSRHLRAGRARRPGRGEGVRPAGGRVLAALRLGQRGRAGRWSPIRASRRWASPARAPAARR